MLFFFADYNFSIQTPIFEQTNVSTEHSNISTSTDEDKLTPLTERGKPWTQTHQTQQKTSIHR